MFLKSLVVRGFKSFASKTVLAFEPGITIVVGPNGSGKSNIVDAISWVLGEQGPRSLRGGKMEDVIYAGSPQRPALGMAEVTLTIDNSAGLLPIEFGEVTISRTLFRSGDSEYRLNGAVCRLLDIQEVLSDTGVGREQHTIIGQGQLDQVLNADPVQMRGLIEEAAGVGKHRRRKERALRKIAGTEQNLERLGDLLAEIRRQLRPLREQAEVARRYERIAEDSRRAHIVLSSRELAAALNALGPGGASSDSIIEDKQAELSKLDARLGAAETARVELSKRTETSRETAWAFGRSIERLDSLSKLASERARTLEAELAVTTEVAAQAQVRELKRQEAETGEMLVEAGEAENTAVASSEKARLVLEGAITELRRSEEALAARALRNEEIFERVSAELKHLDTAVRGVRALLHESLQSLDRPQARLKAKESMAALEESLEMFQAKLAELQPTIESGKEEVEGLRQINSRASAAHHAAASSYDEARLSAGMAKERKRLLEERRSALKDALATALESVSGVEGRRRALSRGVETAVRIGKTAGALSSEVAHWALEADENYRHSRESLAGLEQAISQLRIERIGLAGALDDLRARAREEDLSRSEARIKVRILEEKMRQDWQSNPATMIKKFGYRWEVEDPSVLEDPLERLAVLDDESLRRRAVRLDQQMEEIGRVNPLAETEFRALTEREEFLAGQIGDVKASRRDLIKVVNSVDDRIEELFGSAFSEVAAEYERLFAMLFPGGRGRLRLTDRGDVLNSGVEVEARPGGKNLRRLSLLSGGERALSALAVLFAIFRARPSPFYILDEVEAALDDVNLHRFLGLLAEFRASSQLLVVTHQKRTMEIADVLYGVSVGPDGTSKVISERMSQTSGPFEAMSGEPAQQ